MSTESAALHRYLTLDEEDLLEQLGEALLGSGPGFGPADVERSIRFARAWLEDRSEELKQRVCVDVWPSLEQEGTFDTLTDAAAVADSLQTLLGKPTAFIVAVILIRRGLESFCS